MRGLFWGEESYLLPSHADINKCSAFAQSSLERVRDGASAVLVIKKQHSAMCMYEFDYQYFAILKNIPLWSLMMNRITTCPPPHSLLRFPWKAMVRHNWNLITGYGYEPGCMPPLPENESGFSTYMPSSIRQHHNYPIDNHNILGQ